MMKFTKAYFSPEKKIVKLEKKLQNAYTQNNPSGTLSIFGKGFLMLLRSKKL